MLNPRASVREVEDIRKGIFPEEMGSAGMWNLLKRMVSLAPDERPDADDIVVQLETIIQNIVQDI